MTELLPEAALAPILVFVGLEITAQTFAATPKRHYQAVTFSFLPPIATLLLIQLNGVLGNLRLSPADLSGETAETFQMIVLISNGFVITSLLWGSALALIIDKQLKRAAAFLGIAAALTLVGIIHSPFADGRLFLPGQAASMLPLLIASAYALSAFFLFFMSKPPNKTT